MPSITASMDGFYVTHIRRDVRLSCRCRSREEAEKMLRHMIEDVVVSLPRIQVHFCDDKTLVIRKANKKSFRDHYVMTDFDFKKQKSVNVNINAPCIA
jgi:hypothetical protein